MEKYSLTLLLKLQIQHSLILRLMFPVYHYLKLGLLLPIFESLIPSFCLLLSGHLFRYPITRFAGER